MGMIEINLFRCYVLGSPAHPVYARDMFFFRGSMLWRVSGSG
jgi:hypothetical protein